jgi:hypothetical protein
MGIIFGILNIALASLARGCKKKGGRGKKRMKFFDDVTATKAGSRREDHRAEGASGALASCIWAASGTCASFSTEVRPGTFLSTGKMAPCGVDQNAKVERDTAKALNLASIRKAIPADVFEKSTFKSATFGEGVKVSCEAAAIAEGVKVSCEAAAVGEGVKVSCEAAAIAEGVKVSCEAAAVAEGVWVSCEAAAIAEGDNMSCEAAAGAGGLSVGPFVRVGFFSVPARRGSPNTDGPLPFIMMGPPGIRSAPKIPTKTQQRLLYKPAVC